MAAVALLLLALIGGLIYAGVKSSQEFEQHCRALGGHVKTVTSSGIGYDTKGRPVVTSTSTDYCLSADGRILDTE